MASLRMEWGVLQREICEALAISFVAPHPNSSVVLQAVWPQNAEMIMRAMVSLYEQDKANIGRVLDVCQELRVLEVGSWLLWHLLSPFKSMQTEGIHSWLRGSSLPAGYI